MDAATVTVVAFCMHCDWREGKDDTLEQVIHNAKQHVIETNHTVNTKSVIEPAVKVRLAS